MLIAMLILYPVIYIWDHIITYELLRAIMEISLGTILYLISAKISKMNFTTWGGRIKDIPKIYKKQENNN